MNIKTLVTHVIDRAIDKVVLHVQQEDDSLLTRLAAKINLALLGEHVGVDYEDLATALDYNAISDEISLVELASEINMTELSQEIDMTDIARGVDLADLAGELDLSGLSEQFDLSDLTREIDPEDIAEHISIKPRDVAEHIDYAELAKNLNPMEALAATGSGVNPAQDLARLNLDSIAGKLLDAAVDRLLIAANKSVEEDLASAQVEAQETAQVNGAADFRTLTP
jgi:hypothetical protein